MRAVERRFKRAATRLVGGLGSKRKLDLSSVDLDSIKRILLVKQHDQLGDFLLFTPVIPAVRKRFPDAQIVLCTRGYTKELARTDPLLDGVIAIEDRLNHWRARGLIDAVSNLMPGFDLAVIFNTKSHSFTSDLIPLLGRSRYRLGPSEPRFPHMEDNAFYNLEVSVPEKTLHMSDRCLAIVEPLGVPVDDPKERMYVEEVWDREASRVLQEWGIAGNGNLLAVHPGGSQAHKRWPLERYSALGNQLSAIDGARVLVVVGKNETWGEEVAGRMDSESIVCRIANIKLLAAVLRRVSVYVGNDTGLLHLAAAVGTRSVGVYGRTDPRMWKPRGSHVVSVRARNEDIASVSVQEVYAAVMDMLQ